MVYFDKQLGRELSPFTDEELRKRHAAIKNLMMILDSSYQNKEAAHIEVLSAKE